MTEFEMLSAAQGYIAHGSVTLMNAFTVLAAYLAWCARLVVGLLILPSRLVLGHCTLQRRDQRRHVVNLEDALGRRLAAEQA